MPAASRSSAAGTRDSRPPWPTSRRDPITACGWTQFGGEQHNPAQAKKLLAEAGYSNGFDAGDLTPFPPFFSLAESIGGYLQTVGIRTHLRTMERAAFLTA